MLLADWNTRFPNCDPVAHELRVAFSERWVRFHSLPESKRYPGDEMEFAVVLDRHNRVLEDLAKPNEVVVLLTTGYSEFCDPVRSYDVLVGLDPRALPWRTVGLDRMDEENYWHVFASEWQWRPHAFDPLVRLVADNTLANVMIVAADCRWLLHPYDGGMDVILESARRRDDLMAKHPHWLSAREDGL